MAVINCEVWSPTVDSVTHSRQAGAFPGQTDLGENDSADTIFNHIGVPGHVGIDPGQTRE